MALILNTSRLTLRIPVAEDAEAITLYLNNFAVAGNLGPVPYPYARADAEAWLAPATKPRSPEETGFAIILDGAGYIGQVSFAREPKSPTLGYWLAEPFWHRGLMTEAAKAAVDWYFNTTGNDIIYSGAFQFNKASLAVQKKLGFSETGSNMRHCLARGHEVRHIDTELTRAAWKEGQNP